MVLVNEVFILVVLIFFVVEIVLLAFKVSECCYILFLANLAAANLDEVLRLLRVMASLAAPLVDVRELVLIVIFIHSLVIFVVRLNYSCIEIVVKMQLFVAQRIWSSMATVGAFPHRVD